MLETSKSISRLNLQSQGKTANTPVSPLADAFPAINNNVRAAGHHPSFTVNNNHGDADQKTLPFTPAGELPTKILRCKFPVSNLL